MRWLAHAGTVGAIGPALKAVQNRMDAGRLAQADALVRQRSPLYQAMTQGAPTAPVFPSAKNALVRALMAQQGQDPHWLPASPLASLSGQAP